MKQYLLRAGEAIAKLKAENKSLKAVVKGHEALNIINHRILERANNIWKKSTGKTDVWCDLGRLVEFLVKRDVMLENALRGIIEIGKRDMTNPKYDGYFAEAREVLALPPRAIRRPSPCLECGAKLHCDAPCREYNDWRTEQ
jgi:hypothetical protein